MKNKLALSKFGEKFTRKTGILELMDDLSGALQGNQKKYMLGGGNPAHITEVQNIFKNRVKEILNNEGEFEKLIGNYYSQKGIQSFLDTIAAFFNREYGWNITSENVTTTVGSQTAYFYLFNMLAGEFKNRKSRKILFPIVPEYIGYADEGLSENLFTSIKPIIEITNKHEFKYKIDFDNLKIEKDIAAICVSRPTNPTGNVVTDQEIAKLLKLVKKHNIYLMIDNAYGAPAPDVLFTNSKLIWNENIILTMSLSKLGLPGTRTGIIIANKEIISAVSKINAIVTLANPNLGQIITEPLFKNSEIIRISKNLIKPFYKRKSELAQSLIAKNLNDDIPYFIHKNEGSFFLWLWFKDIPGGTYKLYERLKKRNTIVVPGKYFYPGFKNVWKHKDECIRMNYSQSDEDMKTGIKIICEEVVKSYQHSSASNYK